ncbi:MAG: (2Fe-2S)-binding protein [Candidatus Izimaplasma sp.]|nr:(2Fe-2S)-binding protein [Candidatus Izimaplasma bacterium]
MRIKEHPILTFEEKKKLSFFFDGKVVFGYEGDTIASALHAIGVKVLSRSIELNRPRGFYCAIGNCSSCYMIVNGKPNVKTCVTLLEEGVVVKTQVNKGDIYENN